MVLLSQPAMTMKVLWQQDQSIVAQFYEPQTTMIMQLPQHSVPQKRMKVTPSVDVRGINMSLS